MTQELFWKIFDFWIWAFVFTLAVEIPIFVLIGRWRVAAAERGPIWQLALAGGAGTCLTHPLLWFIWPLVISNYTIYIVTGELLVLLIEIFTFYLIARRVSLGRAALAALLANLASYLGGLAIN